MSSVELYGFYLTAVVFILIPDWSVLAQGYSSYEGS